MIDFEKIKFVYNIASGIQLSDIKDILAAAKNNTFATSEYLIQEGTIKREVFCIQKGLVRSFFVNQKGDEITKSLFIENKIIASPDIILDKRASRFYYQALEPTEILSIDYDLLQTIISKNPKLEQNRKYIFQKMLREANERIDSFVLLSPEERYIDYIKSNPEIANRVPDKYIANVLGITPVSLSRIRKRIASKKK